MGDIAMLHGILVAVSELMVSAFLCVNHTADALMLAGCTPCGTRIINSRPPATLTGRRSCLRGSYVVSH
jgi:hypothetical protein